MTVKDDLIPFWQFMPYETPGGARLLCKAIVVRLRKNAELPRS